MHKKIRKNFAKNFIFTLLAILLFPGLAMANEFSLQVSEIKNNQKIPAKYIFNGFGCDGKNISPEISWQNTPKEAKSFALTVYDPDAPTGSGWWHWLVINIPATQTSITKNFGSENKFRLNQKIKQIRNDYGVFNYGGPCPPKGDKPHRYIFTLHALKTEELELDETATAAKAGYFINQNSISSAKIEGIFDR